MIYDVAKQHQNDIFVRNISLLSHVSKVDCAKCGWPGVPKLSYNLWDHFFGETLHLCSVCQQLLLIMASHSKLVMYSLQEIQEDSNDTLR